MAEVENLYDRLVILNNGNIAFCGTATELTDMIGEKYFIHIKTRQGNSTFETDNIEDTLISLFNDLKQKKFIYWILKLTVVHLNNILSKWQGGKQNERFFIWCSVTVEIGYTK